MKNKFLLLVALLFSWMSEGVAAIVPAQVAAETAKVMLTHRGGSEFKGGEAQVETVSRGDKPMYYIVRFEQGGWAMISAEDTTEPLLGYSFDGEIAPMDQTPAVIQDWFEGYIAGIERVRQTPGLKRHYGWDGDVVTRATEGRISPLIEVSWNQTDPYNALCPSNSSGRAVVGCVAVAMAQAMSVVQYPLRGTGTKTYVDSATPGDATSVAYGQITVDFDNEADYNWDAIMAGSNNSKEVARLLYHCGVLVEMDYSPTGSGTMTDYVPSAIKTYYGFPESCVCYARNDYGSDERWKELLISDLKRGRAIIYAGQNSEVGHCFNLDGYDGVNMFHVNWGWGGMSDGYFTIDALDPANQGVGGSSAGYNVHQRAVVGVAPLSEAPYDIRLSTNRVSLGAPAGAFVADVTVYSDIKDAEYDFVLEGPKKSFPPGTTARSEASYEIRDNKLYTTKAIDDKAAHKKVLIRATNKSSGNSYEKEFDLQVVTSAIDEVLVNDLKLYPVPATDMLTIEVPAEGEYTIYNVAGMFMQRGELTEGTTSLDISALASGSYMLRYSTVQGVAMKSFIVK